MRKNTKNNRFPESAALFKFCFNVLQSKDFEGKVSEQNVGESIGLSPSDTSHWKKGNKAIRQVQDLLTLSKTLDIEYDLLQSIAEGIISQEDAWLEYDDGRRYDEAYSFLSEAEQKKYFEHCLIVDDIVGNLYEKAGLRTSPVFLPELMELFPFISIYPDYMIGKLARALKDKRGGFVIRYQNGEMKPHVRLAIARELAKVLVLQKREVLGLPNLDVSHRMAAEVLEMIYLSNSFLVPKITLVRESSKIPTRQDMTKGLSALFWVPQSVIRMRVLDVWSTSILQASQMSLLPVMPQSCESVEFTTP